MSENIQDVLKQVWPDWEIEGEAGMGAFGTVFRAVRRDIAGVSRAAVKVVAIPGSEEEAEAVRAQGCTEEEFYTYFEQIVRDYVSEIRLLNAVKGFTNIAAVDDYRIYHREGRPLWYILIRMELLNKVDYRSMDEEETIRLGTDLCTALEVCRKKNIVHRDVKPENILVNDIGDYKLADFGVARSLESTRGSLSVKGTPSYMAPEIYRGALKKTDMDAAARADIYSLGLVLYWISNGCRLPFIPEKQLPSPPEREDAFRRRMDGGELPPPARASEGLKRVIAKACAYDPAERYGSAAEMREALQNLKNGAARIPELPGGHAEDSADTPADGSAAAPGAAPAGGPTEEAPPERPAGSGRNENAPGKDRKRKKSLPALLILLLLAAAAAGAAVWNLFLKPVYTVTWINWDGTVLATDRDAAGGSMPVYSGAAPERAEDERCIYAFAGWEPEPKEVTGNAAYRAVFREAPRLYTVTWEDDEGNKIGVDRIGYGVMPEHADPVREPDPQYTYAFTDWEPARREVTGDVTYRAVFRKEIRTYTITWLDDTGGLIDTTTAAYGEIPVHGDPEKKPDDRRLTYTFAGWKPAVTAVEGDAAYTASFRLNLTTGDYVELGTYPQTKEGTDRTPIEWLVLSAEEDRALLISRYGLESRPYNINKTDITWEYCTLRTWLNDTFFSSAFSAEEQKGILLTGVDNSRTQGYSAWNGDGGNDTTDRIFLLSYGEAHYYLDVTYNGSTLKSRMAPTEYAAEQKAYKTVKSKTSAGEPASWWWLRSPADNQQYAARVSTEGALDYTNVDRQYGCVRPAMWIDLCSGVF